MEVFIYWWILRNRIEIELIDFVTLLFQLFKTVKRLLNIDNIGKRITTTTKICLFICLFY